MTMIVGFHVRGVPILIGDLLLSAQGNSDRPANVPLVGDVNRLFAANRISYEVGTTQKVNVFNGRIAVAWSGPLIQAERVLKVLERISKNSDLTPKLLMEEVNAIDQSKIAEVQLIGFLMEDIDIDTYRVEMFDLGADGVKVGAFGEVLAAGSGSREIISFLAENEQLADSEPEHAASAVIAMLTGQEVKTGGSLPNLWGGGFEAATIIDNRFQKIGSVLHTFWDVEGESRLNLRSQFYKMDYFEDALVIRVAAVSNEGGLSKLSANDVHIITPPLKTAKNYDLSKFAIPDFSSATLCCHVSAGDEVYLHIEQLGNGNNGLLFSMEESDINLRIDPRLINDLQRAVTSKT